MIPVMDHGDVCQVVTTVDTVEAARALARSAVEARLAACAQVGEPIFSQYWWKGSVDTAREWPITFKTTVAGYSALEEHIRAQHSYEVPEIVCLPIVAGNPTYLQWVRDNTG